MSNDVHIGIIGGSGVYQIDNVKVIEEKAIKTPFGDPSEKIMIAEISGKKVAFLPRHGKGHRITPTDLPVKANIWALKSLGVKNIISISAVGSLKEDYAPRHFVMPNQIIDRTKTRDNTYFGDGIVGHLSFADPFDNKLSDLVYSAIKGTGIAMIHKDATYLCMEGPLFSTRAESHMYRSWGCGIIGMTAIPEAKLAREAEIAYTLIAMVTDYDCWKEDEEAVTIQTVLDHMRHNVDIIKKCLPAIISAIPDNFHSENHEAAKFGIMTNINLVPKEVKEKLSLFYGKYWNS